MRVLEKFLWIMFIASVIWGINSERLYITVFFFGALLALFYLLFTFFLLNGIKGMQLFKKTAYRGLTGVRVLSSISMGCIYAFAVTAAVFRMLHWRGSVFVIFFSFLATAVSTVLVVIKLRKTNEASKQFYKRALRRNVVFVFLVTIFLVLYFLPRSVEDNFLHPNYRGQSVQKK